jgi:hypothetical protein
MEQAKEPSTGIQDFSEVIKLDGVYVDKTAYRPK